LDREPFSAARLPSRTGNTGTGSGRTVNDEIGVQHATRHGIQRASRRGRGRNPLYLRESEWIRAFAEQRLFAGEMVRCETTLIAVGVAPSWLHMMVKVLASCVDLQTESQLKARLYPQSVTKISLLGYT
jgi:hypothetical protein